MAKSNLRLYTLNSLKDTLNKKSNWLDMGVSHVEPRFVNSENITGARYSLGAYAFNYNEDITYNFSSSFTMSFWAKSSAGAITDDVYVNTIAVVIAGTAISVDIPSTVDLTLWNYFIITRDADNVLSISINGNVIYTDTHAGDFNLSTDGYVYIGNQTRYTTGFNFDIDDFIVYDDSVDATIVASEYLDLSNITQILIIDSSGQVWGYSYDGSSSGGGSDVTVPSATLSLTSEEDEIIIPDGITAIRYSLIEDGEPITRQIAVEPTDKVKYYKEEGYDYYTLAVYDSKGTIKSKGYTMHSNSEPSIDIEYGADINGNFTVSDEYNGFDYVANVSGEALPLDTEFVVPAGICSVRYDMFESCGGAVTVKTGNILKYTIDTSDSTKFTLSLYDKNKNKKRDLYTWCNDNVTITYGTNLIFNDSRYLDITKVSTYDVLSVGQSFSIPSGTHSIFVIYKDNVPGKLFSYNFSYISVGAFGVCAIKSNDTVLTMTTSVEFNTTHYKLVGNNSKSNYISIGHPNYKIQYRIFYGEYFESYLASRS